MHSQIYSGLSLIFAILRNFRVAGAKGGRTWILLRPPIAQAGQTVFFFIQSIKKNTL